MMKIKNLSIVTASGQKLLSDLSCSIPAGSITTLIGKSGAGKTTLLRIIAGLCELESQGTIEIDDKEIKNVNNIERACLVGFVFQDFNLFENLTALDNCIQPLIVAKRVAANKARARAIEILSKLGMGEFLSAYPKNLSGGQKQRVAIARALCMGSRALLLDEPTSALDPENTRLLVDLLNQLCKQGIAILVSSQDTTFVHMTRKRLYLLQEGKIVESFDTNSDVLPEASLLHKFFNL